MAALAIQAPEHDQRVPGPSAEQMDLDEGCNQVDPGGGEVFKAFITWKDRFLPPVDSIIFLFFVFLFSK